jgi:hypothetical protein
MKAEVAERNKTERSLMVDLDGFDDLERLDELDDLEGEDAACVTIVT